MLIDVKTVTIFPNCSLNLPKCFDAIYSLFETTSRFAKESKTYLRF